METKKNVLIVINYNDESRTTELVKKSIEMEIYSMVIIVDNCSNENSWNFIFKTFSLSNQVHLIRNNNNLGYGKGNNSAFEYLAKNNIKPDFVTLINSDVIYESKTVSDCINFMEKHSDCGACSTKMLSWDNKIEKNHWDFSDFKSSIKYCFYITGRRFRNIDNHIVKYNTYSKVDVLRGTLVVYRFDVILNVGFFDDKTFLYWEEDCLAKKMEAIGFYEYLINTNTFIHNHKIKQIQNIKFGDKMRMYLLFLNSMIYFNKKYNNVRGLKLIILKLCKYYCLIEKFFLVGIFKILHLKR